MAPDERATLIGFVGVALLLVAFVLNLFKLLRSDGQLYLGLNFAGAALACYRGQTTFSSTVFTLCDSTRENVVCPRILEGVWALFALVSMVRLLLSRAGPAAR